MTIFDIVERKGSKDLPQGNGHVSHELEETVASSSFNGRDILACTDELTREWKMLPLHFLPLYSIVRAHKNKDPQYRLTRYALAGIAEVGKAIIVYGLAELFIR